MTSAPALAKAMAGVGEPARRGPNSKRQLPQQSTLIAIYIYIYIGIHIHTQSGRERGGSQWTALMRVVGLLLTWKGTNGVSTEH